MERRQTTARSPRTGGGGRHPRCAALGVALAAALIVFPAAAPAQDRLPDDNAGTGQYVEPVPDAGGDRPATPGRGPGRGDLPADTRDQLPAGEEGRALERIATDPGSGAPTGTTGTGGSAGGGGGGGKGGGGDSNSGEAGGDRAQPGADEGEGAVGAAAEAAVGDDGPGVPLLVLAVIAVRLAAVGVGRARRRDV